MVPPGQKQALPASQDEAVAEAVKSTYPDEAVAIWKQPAEREITRVKPAAYKVAATYLKKVHVLFRKEKRTAEWNAYLLSLKQHHKAKRRLIETLNTL